MTAKKNVAKSFISFAPFGSDDPEILIIGTAPGEKSLSCGEYYAGANNCFWEMIAEIYNGAKALTEDEKEKCLIKNKIALWDIYESGMRAGSADNNISNAQIRNLEEYLRTHPNIKKIIFNGQNAYDVYKKMGIAGPQTIVAQSTSGQNTHHTKESKISMWRDCLK